MSIPVVVASNGIGLPVRQVEGNAPVMQVAANGFGLPIVLTPLGAPFVVQGLGPDIEPISAMYGTQAGQVPMRLQSSQAVMSGENVQSVPNAGGAGTAFSLIAGTTAITRTADGKAMDLTPEEWLRFNNVASTAGPYLMNTTVFIVAAVTLGGVDQYFMGNGNPQANVWLVADGTQMRFNRSNPTTSTFETVTVTLSPAVEVGIRTYEIEFTPGTPAANGQTTGGVINVRVNGVMRGSAPHPYPEFRVWNFSAGQNPVNGNGLRAQVYDTLSIIRGGAHDTRVPAIRQQLLSLYPEPVAPAMTGGSMTIA